MLVKEAVVLRFKELCQKEGIKYNELANRSGTTPSTVYSFMSDSRKDVTINTIKILCDGLEISLGDFFSSKVFDNLEQEIR